jgi:peptidoglycan hydrolase-like protein with peptidoglycan-binding domain
VEPGADGDPIWPPMGGPQPFIAPDWTSLPDLDVAPDPTTVDGRVKLVQAMLNAAGAALPILVIDGNFGPLTATAIRNFRTRSGLPDQTSIDATTWLALALAAPFPQLEPGPKEPPMTGPPIAIVQKLLNIAVGPAVIAEDGVYSPETAAQVTRFQSDRGLAASGVIDPVTWLAFATTMDDIEPSATERITLDFDRQRAQGGAALLLTARTLLEGAAPPASDPLDEDLLGRPGFWVEIQDASGGRLFRQILGEQLNEPLEVPPDAGTGDPIGRPGDPPATATIELILPILPTGKKLVVFGAIDGGADQPSVILASFDL